MYTYIHIYIYIYIYWIHLNWDDIGDLKHDAGSRVGLVGQAIAGRRSVMNNKAADIQTNIHRRSRKHVEPSELIPSKIC